MEKLKVRLSLRAAFGSSSRTDEPTNLIRLRGGPFDKAPFIVGLESVSTCPRAFLLRHLRLYSSD